MDAQEDPTPQLLLARKMEESVVTTTYFVQDCMELKLLWRARKKQYHKLREENEKKRKKKLY